LSTAGRKTNVNSHFSYVAVTDVLL